MSLHVVVVNYQTPDDLDQCLASLAEHAPTRDHVVTIVNNEPTTEDASVAERHAVSQGWVIKNHETNVGYARACNDAGTADRDVAAFFNADVCFTAGLLDACHDALLANDNWGVLGPRQVDPLGRITHAGIFGTDAKPALRGWHRRVNAYRSCEDNAISVSGSAYFVKAQAWNELATCPIFLDAMKMPGIHPTGAFLPTQHYYEETWLSYHARAHGWKVVYWGEHTMIHKWHQASPLGGHADKGMAQAREMFRYACDVHGLDHD